MKEPESVLILGGSGQAGGDAAALLRRWHPDLPLTIAGRDLPRAQRVADDLGGATAVMVDLGRGDLGLPSGHRHSAIVAALWDDHLNGLHYAQRHGIPYLSLSSALVDIAPEVIASAQRATTGPVLMVSHWCAGVVVLATLYAALSFECVEAIRVGVLMDELDVSGPAGLTDLERWSTASSAGLIRRDGVFTWLDAANHQSTVISADNKAVPALAIPVLDVPSLGLATSAPNVRLDLAWASPRAGAPEDPHPSRYTSNSTVLT